MKKIIDILIAALGLGKTIYNCIDLDSLRDFHARVVARTIWILAGLVIIMVGLNYFDFKSINLLISLLLSLVSITIFTKPEPLVATAVAGVISGTALEPQTIKSELHKLFNLYFRTVGDAFFWISIFGLFLGTIPCEENPKAVIAIAVALIVFGYGAYRWGFTTGFYKKVVYNYSILVLIVSLLSFIPAHIQIHYAGRDFGALFHSSKGEIALSKVEKAQREKLEELEQNTLTSIENKIKKGTPLSDVETAALTAAKDKREKNSLPNKISEGLSAISWPALPTWTRSAEAKPAETKSEPPAKDSAASAIPSEKWKIRHEKLEGGYSDWKPATVKKDGDQITIETVSNGRRILFEGKEENGILSGWWKQQDPPNKDGKFCLEISIFEMKGYHTDSQKGEKQFPFQLKR